MPSEGLPVIFLMGPTASGKTELALSLHDDLPVEIISADSAMVYRGMDIGTAKPDREIRSRVTHHLIDICDPAEAYSAGRFQTDARALIDVIHAQRRIPLVTGGTGLYFRALEQGFSELPPADPSIRERISRLAQIEGWDALHAQLAHVDTESAARIHVNDPQRIQRALEVFELTGKPLSEFFSLGRARPLPYRIIKILINPQERNVIHERIAERFERMLELGLVDEVRTLYERGDLTPVMPSIRMVGYRQVWRYLDGKLDFGTMREHAIISTRQLAKRQLTWLRSEQGAIWIDSSAADLQQTVLKIIRHDPTFHSEV
ncbi:MAG: tRNA (adenosine(37)-N6)-dimethylallyltransferase MiaA [Gammaproteobacteria bacterium]|jgi:tRNA dimethylallyltransferase|nr:MAG: tRNA (adenosine(37)-N6)-dimethylallyltransferase MiaA [Gammaproteobacteria bacterium]